MRTGRFLTETVSQNGPKGLSIPRTELENAQARRPMWIGFVGLREGSTALQAAAEFDWQGQRG